MKQLIFISILFLLPLASRAQEISDDQINFVNDFVAACKNHDYKKVYKHLDKSYRKEQRKFLKGNKTQLMDELFGGTGIDDDEFVVIPISEIIKIEVAEVMENEDGSFEYIFRVRDAKHDILAYLQLEKKGKRFGFVGAVG